MDVVLTFQTRTAPAIVAAIYNKSQPDTVSGWLFSFLL